MFKYYRAGEKRETKNVASVTECECFVYSELTAEMSCKAARELGRNRPPVTQVTKDARHTIVKGEMMVG